MNLSLGIVGLPNVGKSTLFNALTKQSVPAENYPFCTIDPNVGIVPVSDERVTKLAEMSKPAKVTPAVVEFVDIAGLVKGAASGEGLGNKFLSNIKEVSAIVHVVRAFENTNVTHVENSVDPIRDVELINTELIFKDVDTIEHRIKSLKARARFEPKVQKAMDHFEELKIFISTGKLAQDLEVPADELTQFERKSMFLLTDKPVIYLINATDEAAGKAVAEKLGGKSHLIMDIKQEYELASMNDEDRQLFMDDLGLSETGLDSLTKVAYSTLGLISFLTEGPEEVRAWTIKVGSTAPQAAGTIHTDFEKNFIAAEVCNYADFVAAGGWQKAKEVGKVRLEGKTYIVKDGDIMIIKHNA